MMKRNRGRKEQKERKQKEYISRAERTIQVMVKTGQYQNGSKRGSRFMLDEDLSVTATTKNHQVLLKAARASSRKIECQVQLTGIERKYWMGTEIRDWEVRFGLPRHSEVMASEAQSQRVKDPTKRGENQSMECESAKEKEMAAEKGKTRRGRMQLEPS